MPRSQHHASNAARATRARTLLLGWYRKNGRKLPWRKTTDPYPIWISEVMLQQTQVSRVLHYYPRFLKRFPTIESLAKANWRELLPLWRGLGYYRRGENLLYAARKIVSKFNGSFPEDEKSLRSLPGVGRYTAHAIQSFAFRKNVAAVDTNIRRVLSRIFQVSDKEVESIANLLFQSTASGSHTLNHALMDLGATICRSQRADCGRCPLQKVCASAYTLQPTRRKRRTAQQFPQATVAVAVIWREKEFLLLKSEKQALTLLQTDCPSRATVRTALKQIARAQLGVELSVRPPFYSVLRQNGRREKVRYDYCRCQILRGRIGEKNRTSIWVGK